MRIIIAGILGGVLMFIWSSVAHIALPLGQIGLSQIPNEAPVLTALHNSIGDKTGLFFFPWTDMKSPNAMADEQVKMKTNPSGILIYHPPGAPDMTMRMLSTEFLKELFVSLVAAFLLAQTMLNGYLSRVGFVSAVGLVASVTTNVSYWNWYGFPFDYTLSYAFTDFAGYVAAGLGIAAVVRRRA
jgi:hypothetical protein